MSSPGQNMRSFIEEDRLVKKDKWTTEDLKRGNCTAADVAETMVQEAAEAGRLTLDQCLMLLLISHAEEAVNVLSIIEEEVRVHIETLYPED